MNSLPAHGTEARYHGTREIPGCRCELCRKKASKNVALRELDRLAGRGRRVDAVPVWDWILQLRAAGLNDTQIGRAAGVHQTVISRTRTKKYLSRETADKIRAVRPNHRPKTGFIPVVGAERRLRALYVLRHSRNLMARELGVSTDYVARMVRGEFMVVSVEFDQAVRGLYARLRTSQGTSNRTGNYAARQGWHGPLAWHNIDDPNERPETDSGPRGQRHESVIEQTAELAAQGEIRQRIAARIGISWDAIARAHHRNGVQLPEIVEAAA